MARVVPSQIVSLIDRNRISWEPGVSHASAGVLTAIVRLVDELPTELLTISGADYDDLVCGVEAIRNAVAFWHHISTRGFVGLTRINEKQPPILIRDALAKCPDQAPSPVTAELSFIADADLRANIRLDISAAFAAFHDGNWKAATVLAGAATEALLLWSIQQAPSLSSVASIPKGSPECWKFSDYIRVALDLKVIEPETAKQATLAKDFRNLIHPGRAQRLGQVCDKATALTALAAAELIVRGRS
jgi:hypothetical protein